MKTKTLIELLRGRNYRVQASEISVIKIWLDNELVAYVDPNRRFVMSVYRKDISAVVFDILVDYASTPVEERKEPKRWRLKVNLPAVSESYYNDEVYLNQNRKSGKTVLSSCAETSNWKTVFTEKDLKDIDETGFKRVPVEDDKE